MRFLAGIWALTLSNCIFYNEIDLESSTGSSTNSIPKYTMLGMQPPLQFMSYIGMF